MSMFKTLDTMLAALEDPTTGLSAQITTLVAGGAPVVSAAVAFGKWALTGEMQPATMHAVIVRPAFGRDTTKKQQENKRDGLQQIAVVFETFNADQDAIQDAITVAQLALLMVLDGLVAYSHAHNGQIIEILDPVDTTYGVFDGIAGATSSGFISTITITERET